MRYLEGGIRYNLQRGHDSLLRNPSENYRDPFVKDMVRIVVGRVQIPETEPIYRVASARITTEHGWSIQACIWPGPSVETNPAGVAGQGVQSIHGLYSAPVQGQSVAVGFIGGNKDRPIVLNTYAHQFSGDTTLFSSLHTLPLTNLLHSGQDIVLGHYTGAFIALRALPLPGSIEVETQLGFSVKSGPLPTEPMLLGDKTKDKLDFLFSKLDKLIDIVMTHVHPSAFGPTQPLQPPESVDLTALKAEVLTEQATLPIIQSFLNENN